MAKTIDRTYLAVRRQLQGMAADGYEVGILDNCTGKMKPRRYTEAQVLKSVAWLKQENFQGAHIYIRPEGSQGLLLVDDIGLGTIETMKADGLYPAAVIETSPMNYQAWVRVSRAPIPNELATMAAKILAERYGSDPNSADWRHYGRLAGFTNRKPEYQTGHGRYPYVLAHECPGTMASASASLLTEARDRLSRDVTLAKERQKLSESVLEAFRGNASDNPAAFFQRVYNRLQEHYGAKLDFSRADWMTTIAMLRNSYSDDQIAAAMAEHSLNIDERKKGHLDDYIHRTIRNAKQDPEVQQALRQYALKLELEDGR